MLCLACGCNSVGSYCSGCERGKKRRAYGGDWRRKRRAIIEEWIAVRGLICPGYGREAHSATLEAGRYGLTVDHVEPVTGGTTGGTGELRVLCKSCNGRKAGHTQPGHYE